MPADALPRRAHAVEAEVAESTALTAVSSLVIGGVLVGVGLWFYTGGLQVEEPLKSEQEKPIASAAPAMIGLPIVMASIVILHAGSKQGVVSAIAAHMAVLVSTIGTLGGIGSAALAFVADTENGKKDVPDHLLLAALSAAHVYFNVLHFLHCKKVRRESAGACENSTVASVKAD